MHHTAIARQVIEQAKSQAKGKLVKRLVLSLGELAPVEPDELEGMIRTLTAWQVSITESGSLVNCECGFSGRAKIVAKGHDFTLFTCPKCGRTPKVIDGDGIKILKVET